MKLPGNILKHLFQSKSVQTPFANVYNFDTMIVETDKSKLEELRKNKHKSFTVKTSKHIRIGYAMEIDYLEDMGHENAYFCYIGNDCLDVFAKKIYENLPNFATFPRK